MKGIIEHNEKQKEIYHSSSLTSHPTNLQDPLPRVTQKQRNHSCHTSSLAFFSSSILSQDPSLVNRITYTLEIREAKAARIHRVKRKQNQKTKRRFILMMKEQQHSPENDDGNKL